MSRARRYDLARARMETILRDEPIPELPWDDIERRLMARLDDGASGRLTAPYTPRRIPTWIERALPLAAAAAVVALAVRVGGSDGAPAMTEPPARVVDLAAILRVHNGATDDLDLRALRPGDVIETSAAEVSLLDAGVVRWTLAPQSRALVRAAGARGIGQVIRLDRGSLHAEVTPRDPAEGLVEVFAVEVGGTRVAVHGTLFRVTRLEDRVEVDVERGTVAIGPAAHAGATTGHVLVAPARAWFSLDGGRTARLLPPASAPAPRPAAPPAIDARAALADAAGAPSAVPVPHAPASKLDRDPMVPNAARSDAADAPSVAPPTPPQPAAAHTPGSARAALEACIVAKQRDGSPSLQTTIASTLRVAIRADGSVASIRFDPPLKPELQACAEALYSRRFDPPATGSPVEIAIPLHIQR